MRRVIARYQVDLALVAVAAVWGLTFVMVKDAVDRYPPFLFLALRFAIASGALLLVFPGILKRFEGRDVVAGLPAGVFITAGYVFQTLGLMDTGATRAGFITGMAVVMTPILQVLILRTRPSSGAIAGVGFATAGLWLLTGGGPGETWSSGETLVLVAALCFALHWIVLGKVSASHHVDVLTLVQLLTAVLITGSVAVLTEPLGMPPDLGVWIALLVTGVLASTAAFAIQTYALRHISPTRVALILINEPVFAGIFGFILLGERLGAAGWLGSGLILAGMLLSEVVGNLHRSKERLPLEA